MAKLTGNQTLTLKYLSGMASPWHPKEQSYRLLLAALGRLGLADRRVGYPVGWVINDAGRSALLGIDLPESRSSQGE